jgi:SAM-dependent methyltransferase
VATRTQPTSSATVHYIYRDQPDEAELRRLRMLERLADPYTEELLLEIGLSAGWHCLEVGAGAGSTARWLSSQVGPGGRVVALDTDTRFLRPTIAGPGRPEVIEADILVDDLPSGAFDLVHARHVLAHLGDQAGGAVQRMAAALRPGGWLVVEDIDATDLLLATDDPFAQHAANVVVAAFREAIAERGADANIGRRLPTLLEAAGLVGVEVDARLPFRRGGEPNDIAVATLAAVRPALVDSGVDAGLVDRVLDMLSDPSSRRFDTLQVAAWGRMPAGPGRRG